MSLKFNIIPYLDHLGNSFSDLPAFHCLLQSISFKHLNKTMKSPAYTHGSLPATSPLFLLYPLSCLSPLSVSALPIIYYTCTVPRLCLSGFVCLKRMSSLFIPDCKTLNSSCKTQFKRPLLQKAFPHLLAVRGSLLWSLQPPGWIRLPLYIVTLLI